jgi:hypothetical protein
VGRPFSFPKPIRRCRRANRLKILLACGVLYSLVYAVANNVVAATLDEG